VRREVQVARIIMLVLVCAALAGCGTTTRDTDTAGVSDRFHSALDDGDGAAACRELSSETRKKLERDEGQACDEAILGLDLPAGATAARAKVYVTTALVELEGPPSSEFLDEGPDGWKISAAGCSSGAPDRPFDCELEG
jgi:uncharacterized protein YceK